MTDDSIDFEEWTDSGDVQNASLLSSNKGPEKFRPLHRPPMALLLVFDDGQETSEEIRLRNDQTTIGRKADVSIPHDPGIANEHARITRSKSRDKYRWIVQDLDSPGGMFVRVKKAMLRDGTEFLAGSYRYKFVGASTSLGSRTQLHARLEAGSIPGQSMSQSEVAFPSIQRVQSGWGEHLWLIADDYWIGRDKSCGLCVPDDRLLADKHVQLSRSSSGWQLSSFGVTNGFWLRMQEVQVTKSCTFQLGEQRFRLVVDR